MLALSIPTPFPESSVENIRAFFGASALLIVYRSLLVVVGLVLLIAALSSFGAFAAIVIGIVVSVVLADDIRQAIRDLWDMNFWVFRT